ncbi:MAG: hypothetical protein HYY40_07570 [Bacteroidetes bacterium]|nr:hypothetical protein [Bacteroidota bacterium]
MKITIKLMRQMKINGTFGATEHSLFVFQTCRQAGRRNERVVVGGGAVMVLSIALAIPPSATFHLLFPTCLETKQCHRICSMPCQYAQSELSVSLFL